MDEAERWRQLGERLRTAREAMLPRPPSKREAARRAGFSDVTWRQLEAGQKQISKGVFVPMTASDHILRAAARVVDLDPAELFEILDRPYTPLPADDRPAKRSTDERLDAVEAELIRQREVLDELLERLPEEPPGG